jgi:lysophospholipase L1-like esterase
MPNDRRLLILTCLAVSFALTPSLARAVGDGEAGDPDWTRRQFRIVILGSSSAAGAGASRVEWSWAGRLQTALKPLGYTVFNRSVSGSNTAASLERFARDVEPLRPGYVILATSLVNELFYQQREAAARVFVENTKELIRRVESAGAVPILAGPIPNNAFDRNHRRLIRDVYDQLETEGVMVWDFFNASDDGFGRWLEGFSDDGLHPTDRGHQALYDSIPISYFFRRSEERLPAPPRLSPRAWRFAGEPRCQEFLVLTPPAPVSSWTLSFWLSASDVPAPSVILRTATLALKYLGGRITLESNLGSVTSAGSRADTRRAHVALTYHAGRRTAVLYVNGAPAASLNNVEGETDSFRLAGPETAPGLQINDLLLYRTPLAAEDVQILPAGQKLSRSLEAWLPLNVSPYRDPINVLPSMVDVLACRDAWTVVPATANPQ